MGMCGSREDVTEQGLPGMFNGGAPVSLSISAKQLELYDNLNTPVDKDEIELVIDDIICDNPVPKIVELKDANAEDGTGNAIVDEENVKECEDGESVTVADTGTVPECRHIEGHLKKKSPGIMGGWQIRFCVLQSNSILSYYGAEIDFKSNREAKGSINIMDIVPEARNTLLDEEGLLLIPIADRVYEFQGEDESITQMWHDAILSHF